MPDLSSITLPDNNTYNFKDSDARVSILALAASVPNAASIDANGLITFKNGNTSLFTLQLPIYDGSHHSASDER